MQGTRGMQTPRDYTHREPLMLTPHCPPSSERPYPSALAAGMIHVRSINAYLMGPDSSSSSER